MVTSFSQTGLVLPAVSYPTFGNPVRIFTPALAMGWYRLLVRLYTPTGIIATTEAFSFILRMRAGTGRTSHFVKWCQFGDGVGGAGLGAPDEWTSAFPVDYYGGPIELFVGITPSSGAGPQPLTFDIDIHPLGGAARRCPLSNFFGLADFMANQPVVQLLGEIQPLTRRLDMLVQFNPAGADSGSFRFWGQPRAAAGQWFQLAHPYLPNFVRTKSDMLVAQDRVTFDIEPKIWQFVGYTIEGFNTINGFPGSMFPGVLRGFEILDVP